MLNIFLKVSVRLKFLIWSSELTPGATDRIYKQWMPDAPLKSVLLHKKADHLIAVYVF